MGNVPAYNCVYDWFGELEYCDYDGVRYEPEDIVHLTHELESTNRYHATHPRGASDYSIHESRTGLIRWLDGLRERVDAAHPFTTAEMYDLNHPCYEYGGKPAVVYETCEYGWETLDDVKIVLTRVPWCRVPVYAVEFPEPSVLRPGNEKLKTLRRLHEDLEEAVYFLSGVEEEDMKRLCGVEETDVRTMMELVRKVTDQVETAFHAEHLVGRR